MFMHFDEKLWKIVKMYQGEGRDPTMILKCNQPGLKMYLYRGRRGSRGVVPDYTALP